MTLFLIMFSPIWLTLLGAILTVIVRHKASRIPLRPQTPAAILARAMCHPTTIADWRTEQAAGYWHFVNDKMAMRLRERWRDDGLDLGYDYSWGDGLKLKRAKSMIRAREERLRLEAGTEHLVSRLEKAYGTNAQS